MRDLVFRFYRMGIYHDEDLPVFVKVNWISEDDYKELTGKDYTREEA